MEERLANAQHPAVTQCAADDPAQHVTTPLIGGQHTVHDQETARADMVGDDAQRLVLEIGRTGQLGGLADQALEQIDLVVRMDMLEHRGQAFQTHAGVHARRRQRYERAVRLAIELHEDVVPDLDVAVPVLVRGARGTAGDVLAVVVEDLGARTAGAGIGHLPEIVRCIGRALVVADAHDALRRQADHVVPEVVGLVVGVVDRDQQALLGKLPDLGQQLPRPGDGLLLEVVAEGPVAQHLEERVVAGGIPHRIQVVVLAAGPQAALDIGRTHVAALLRPQEHVLELHHAGVGEQQGGIVAGHQGGGRHDGMALAGEEIEEILADLAGAEGLGSGHLAGIGWKALPCAALSA